MPGSARQFSRSCRRLAEIGDRAVPDDAWPDALGIEFAAQLLDCDRCPQWTSGMNFSGSRDG